MDFTSLSFTDVSRSFGRRWALNRVSLRCEAGEIIGLVGANGAGKSTLLSIAGWMLTPSKGQVRYGDIEGNSNVRGAIGFLGHELQLYAELTAAENLTFFGRMYRLPDVAARVERALERARLSDRAHEPVSGFSRGMRQRLALERALLHDPRLVLLDEPFTGLDDNSSSALVARLRELRSRGCIVLLASHDLEIIEPVIDRAVLLRDGRLAALGDGGSLRDRLRRAGN